MLPRSECGQAASAAPRLTVLFGYYRAMRVFISWSGERSKALAEALYSWLPLIINEVKPFLSTGLEKGSRWSSEVASNLAACDVGVICLTPSNLHADWLLFEAGALSKLDNSRVRPLLLDLKPIDVTGPLAQFHSTGIAKDDVKKLVDTINRALADEALPQTHLDKAYDLLWPGLEDQINKLPIEDVPANTHRSQEEMIQEILELVREQSRRPTPLDLVELPPLVPGLERRGLLSPRFSRALQTKVAAVSQMLEELDRVDAVVAARTDGTRLSIDVELRGLGIVPIVFSDVTQPIDVLKEKAEKAIANEGTYGTLDLDPWPSS